MNANAYAHIIYACLITYWMRHIGFCGTLKHHHPAFIHQEKSCQNDLMCKVLNTCKTQVTPKCPLLSWTPVQNNRCCSEKNTIAYGNINQIKTSAVFIILKRNILFFFYNCMFFVFFYKCQLYDEKHQDLFLHSTVPELLFQFTM